MSYIYSGLTILITSNKFANHCDYIHYNPVRHNFCESPQQWAFSTIHRFIQQQIYPLDWGGGGELEPASDIWDI
jgi:putative transposase